MDRSNILVILIGSIIIIAYSFYSFGFYLSSSTSSPKTGTKAEPINNSSDQMVIDTTSKTNNKPLQMILYKNLDKPENYYLMEFPNNVNVLHGNKSGSYLAKLHQGIISIDLMDIPDTSSPELFFLTHVKPELELSLKDFLQVDLNQSSINGNRAWYIAYDWKNSSKEMESVKTLIEGTDEAAVITYSVLKQQLLNIPKIYSTELSPILTSFKWIGQH